MSTSSQRPSGPPSVERVGPYRLCVELASGGMGTVYLARAEVEGRTRVLAAHTQFVAVKVLHPHVAGDAEGMQMFLDEAEIAARILHPNVCRIYEYDVDEAHPYLAMEYLPGRSLAAVYRRLARHRGDPRHTARRVAAALAAVCHGLHAAHQLTDDDGEPIQVVHRDVSPSNLMLTVDGVSKVVDFGVAAAAHKRHQTRTGTFKGKLAYVAPEILTGSPPDARADVWAVGVVAWELVTGHRLFRRGGDLETLQAVRALEIPPPSTLQPELPESVDRVIQRALSRDPSRRYESARELGRALTEVAMDGEIVTTAELADWLEQLFPGEQLRFRELVSLADRLMERRVSPLLLDGSSGSLLALSSVSPVRTASPPAPPPRPPPVPPRPSSIPAPPPPVAEARAPAATSRLALALGLGLALGAGAWHLATHTSATGSVAEVAAEPTASVAAGVASSPAPAVRRASFVVQVEDDGADGLVLRLEDGPPRRPRRETVFASHASLGGAQADAPTAAGEPGAALPWSPLVPGAVTAGGEP